MINREALLKTIFHLQLATLQVFRFELLNNLFFKQFI
jgi:hypothetical protein